MRKEIWMNTDEHGLVKIRKAEKGDLKGVLMIQKTWDDDFYTRKDLIESLKNKDVFFLIAKKNREVVGYILGFRSLVKRNECVLQNTMVDKNIGRQGIGKMLVLEFCNYVKKKGITEVFAELEEEHIPFYIKSCKFKDRGSHVLAMKKL